MNAAFRRRTPPPRGRIVSLCLLLILCLFGYRQVSGSAPTGSINRNRVVRDFWGGKIEPQQSRYERRCDGQTTRKREENAFQRGPLCSLADSDGVHILSLRGGAGGSSEDESSVDAPVEDANQQSAANSSVRHDSDKNDKESNTSLPTIENEDDEQHSSSDEAAAMSTEDEDDIEFDGSDQRIGTPAVLETTTTTVLDHTEDIISSDSLVSSTNTEDLKDIPSIIQQASDFRARGKELHDDGSFAEAASKFGAAAGLLLPILCEDDSDTYSDDDGPADLTEEFATCRLHEALCRLKAEDYEGAVTACTDVLDLDEKEGSANILVAPALRARAFHRRAKAKVELGDEAAALHDARSAAFLGDRKAVALYGKLMRDSSGPHPSSSDTADGGMDLSSPSSPLFDLFGSGSGGLGPSSSSPFGAGSGQSASPFLPSSLLNLGKASPGGTGGSSLAQSVLSSLTKRLEDKQTQDNICNFLQQTSAPQLQSLASMAGLQIPEQQATKIASFCNGVTPKTLQRTLSFTKRAIYMGKLMRKFVQLIAKYRNIIILLFLLAWIKSALLRPIPLSKAAKRAAKAAAKAAKAKKT